VRRGQAAGGTSIIIRCVEPINRDRGRGEIALKFVQLLLPVNLRLPLRCEVHETPPGLGRASVATTLHSSALRIDEIMLCERQQTLPDRAQRVLLLL
jgi:hypothetical protein